MIVEVNFQIFQSVYMKNRVFVKENESSWELWTSEGGFIIRCIVKKEENQERNIMFVERYLIERKNIIKVINVEKTEEGEDEL